MRKLIFLFVLIWAFPALAIDQCWTTRSCKLNADAWGCPMPGALHDLTYAEITGDHASVRLIAKTDSCRRFKKGMIFKYVDMEAATYELKWGGRSVFIYMKYVE